MKRTKYNRVWGRLQKISIKDHGSTARETTKYDAQRVCRSRKGFGKR